MNKKSPERCAGCVKLEAEIASLRATVAQLQEKLAGAKKDSRTSSKPPSSDIVKPAPALPPEGASKRTRGGQPGHPLQVRPLLPEEMVNGGVHLHVPEICPDCGHGLRTLNLGRPPVQQIDLETVPLRIVEHQSVAAWCAACQKM